MRIAAIILVIMIVITALTTFALYNLDTLVNKNKDKIISRIEESTGRQVKIEKIGINILGGLGIELSDFRMKDDPRYSQDYFIRGSDLIVNVKFLPLLRKELAVKKIILNEPTINVISQNGSYNFETLGGPRREQEGVAHQEKDNQTIKRFTIATVDISNGKINYEDRDKGTNLNIEKLDLTSENIGTEKPVRFGLMFALFSEEQNVNISAVAGPTGTQFNLDDIPLEGTLNISSLDTDKLKKNLPNLEKLVPYDPGITGPLDAHIEVEGKTSSLTISKIDVKASVFDSDVQNFSLSGSFGPLGKDFNTDKAKAELEFEAGPVLFEKLRNFKPLKDSFPQELKGNGPVTASGSIKGNINSPDIKSLIISATDTDLSYGDIFRKPEALEFVINTDTGISEDKISMSNSRVVLGSIILDLSGEIKPGETTEIDMAVNSNTGELADLARTLIPIRQYEPSGKFKINTEVKGKYGENKFPDIKGTSKLDNVQIKLPQLEKPVSSINSVISFTGSTASLDETTALIGDSEIRLSADVSGFSPLTITYRISSPAIYLSDITPGRKGDIKDVDINGTMKSSGEETSLSAGVTSAGGEISGLKYTDMDGEINMRGSVLNLEDISFRFLNGQMKAKGYYDMSKTTPSFNFNTSVQGLNITNLIKTLFTSESEHIEGVTNLSLNISGKGSTWEQISNSLNGLGNMELTEGRFRDFNLAEEVLTGLTGIQGLSNLISSEIENKYPEIFKTTSTVFYNMKTPIKIVNGRINFNELLLRSSNYLVKGDGWLSLNKKVKASGFLTLAESLSEDLASRIELVKYLNDEQGRVKIPFVIDGTIPGITPSPDLSTVAEILRKAAVDRGKEQIKKKLFDELKEDNENQDTDRKEESAPPEKQLKDQLKKLIPFPSSEKPGGDEDQPAN